ncbi:hypothetical protein BOO69_00465 [Sulfitobacter alexandrii]|uniref:YjbF family lipoprotein n=1 Tax=Sulfitobacter alexandrii TaxID=1917485 RepID=A0A1J0WCL0_9RHOB|nr:hypothetical protein BOO69_00465 [Sulfitobacter alexandrii]
MFDAIKTRTAGGGAPGGAPLRIEVTRKQLDQTPGAVLQAIPDATQAQDFLRLIAQRDDSNPGTVEVWQSSDNLQVILRNGVLVGTKGLGGDIRSAEAATTFAGFDGQGGGGQRLITIDRTNGTAQTTAFSCDMTQLGRETLQIVDQRVPTYRMREICSYGLASFTNEYWVETGSGKMRKSRQWAGPTVGYIDFLRLKG